MTKAYIVLEEQRYEIFWNFRQSLMAVSASWFHLLIITGQIVISLIFIISGWLQHQAQSSILNGGNTDMIRKLGLTKTLKLKAHAL